MPTPKKHAEIIKAWADGAPIEWRAGQDYEWAAISEWPGWDDKREYRIKPAAPKWPQTTMTEEALAKHLTYRISPGVIGRFGPFYTRLANEAIAHACETGALVPADKVREIEAKARAEGAKAVKLDTIDVIQATYAHMRLGNVNADDLQIILLKAAK